MSPDERSYSVLMSVYGRDRPDYADDAIRSMVAQSAPFTDRAEIGRASCRERV